MSVNRALDEDEDGNVILIVDDYPIVEGDSIEYETCEVCDGAGAEGPDDDVCKACQGSGIISK